MRFGFVGGTYESRSVIADGERCINFYPEVMEAAGAKSKVILLGRAGLRLFCDIGAGPIRALFTVSDRTFGLGDRCFVVGGNTFGEVFADGTFTERGGTTFSTGPASICSNGRQLLIITGVSAYIFDLDTGTFDPAGIGEDVVMGASLNSYFVAMLPNSRNFRVSGPNDGLSWDPLDFGVKQGAPDSIASIFADRGELYLQGSQTTEVWVADGSPDFPFSPYSAGFIQQGQGAQWSTAALDNSLFWLGADARGQGIVWRAHGYTPQRVSNFAIENMINSFPRINDAEGYGEEVAGHSFYVLRFPSAQRTLVFDVATGYWHERDWWDAARGLSKSYRGRCHTWCFGRHLVGDWENGGVWESRLDTYDDFGGPIRGLRRAPHIADQLNIELHRSLTMDMEVGVGLDGGVVPGADPKVMMQYSDDGGRTWSNEKWASFGKIGHTKQRVQWRRLGKARDRVYQIIITDPVKRAIIDAYTVVEPGGRPEARAS